MTPRSIVPALLAAVLAVGAAVPARASLELGVEGGVAMSADRNHDFRGGSALAAVDLPWGRPVFGGWRLRSAVLGNAGVLRGWGDEGGFLSVSPLVSLERPEAGFAVQLGFGPALLTRSHFGGADFGSPFQFMSRIGFSLEVSPGVELGYRFQHMSNANLALPNPGLDMHLFRIGLVWPGHWAARGGR